MTRKAISPFMSNLLPAEQSTVLGQLREGVILTDREGRITFINEAAARFHGVLELGVLPAEYSQTFRLLTDDGRPYPPDELPLARAVHGETVTEGRWSVRGEHGAERIATGAAQPIFGPDGIQTGAMLVFHDDTERVQAERALVGAEERYRMAVQATQDTVWDWDLGTNRIEWNEMLLETYGHRPEGEINSYAWYLSQVHPDDRERINAGLQEAAHGGGTHWSEEYRFRRADGSYAIVCDRGTVARDGKGHAVRMIGAMIDVTARRRAERALHRRTQMLETLNRLAAAMACQLDVQPLVQMATDAGAELTGARVGVFFSHVPNGSGQTMVLQALAGPDRDMFDRLPMPGAAAVFQPSFAGKGVLRSDDITRDPRWADNLPQSSPLNGCAPVRSYLAVPVTSHTGASLGCLIFGHPEPARFNARDERLMVGVAAHAAIAIDNARLFATVQREVDERRRAEERLRELAETLEARVEERTRERDRAWALSRDMQLVIGSDATILAANKAADILGYLPEELVGHNAEEFVHPDDVAIHRAAMTMAEQDAFPAEEIRCLHKDGSYRWLSWAKAADQGLLYASGRDVTLQRAQAEALAAAEQALRQSQKMEAVGQLTGGIAHDFNNMLAVVIGSLDLLKRRLGGDPRALRRLDGAVEAATRAALLTKRLLAFSRQQPLNPRPLDVNRLVAGMSEFVRHSIGASIRLQTVLAGGLWPILVDSNQLENVLLNLAVNARDAMPEGGCLSIETSNTRLDARYADRNGIEAGDYVLIAVTDDGGGMPPEVLARAFDPFFTTKEVGKGTGLGLSQVYGFVRQSGGHVKLYSERGQGTTVKIYLPRLPADAADDAQAASDATSVPGGRQELILVVEDEPAVRQVSIDALEELGYRVLEADGAATALRLLEEHPEVDLVFTDVVMPDVNGRKLADEVHRRRPDLPILFTTGYTRNAIIHHGVLDPDVELLGKPFTVDELAHKVRLMLDER